MIRYCGRWWCRNMENFSTWYFASLISISIYLTYLLILYHLSKRSKKESYIFTGIGSLIIVALSFYFQYSTGDNNYLFLLIGTVLLLCFCALFLVQNKYDRWDEIIESGCYICAARLISSQRYYHSIFFREHYVAIKYSFEDYDSVNKTATCIIRKQMFSDNKSVSNVFVVARALDKYNESRIFRKSISQQQLQLFERGIFVAPGKDPRKMVLVDNQEIREKYILKNQTPPQTPQN